MRAQHLFVAAMAALLAATSAQASVEVSKKPTQNMNCSGGVCSPTAEKAVLNVKDLANMLASGDVAVKSSTEAQDIEIDAALSWTSTARLTLDAYHSIAFNKPVVVAGTGALTIATNDGGRDGDFRFFGKGHIEFWDTASNLVINGQRYQLLKNAKQIVKYFKRGGGNAALARSDDASEDGTFTHPLIPLLQSTFEGLGNTISNLTIVDSDAGNVGFIGTTGTLDTAIRDFGLVNANITGTGTGQAVGTLVGFFLAVRFGNGTWIENCFATGEVSAGSNSIAGGLVGLLDDSLILQSHAGVNVTAGENSKAGGLFGLSYAGVAQSSYATGSVFGGDGATLGGLAGEIDSDAGVAAVIDTFATGPVYGGADTSVGGLVGMSSAGFGSFVWTSYSTGSVSAGANASVGGSIGQDLYTGGNTDAYWDIDTSGINDPSHGAGNIANDPGITGLTTTQFQSKLPAGFSKKVWREKAGINGGYPYLIDLPPV